MALTPQQLAAIQQAAQAGGTGAGQHQTATGIFGDEYNSLLNSGLFNPSDLSGVQSQNPGANGAWGSGAAPVMDWDAQLQQILGNAGQMDAAVQSFTSDQSTPAQQAIAPVASGGQGYNPLQPAYLSQPATLNATTVNPSYAQTAQLDPRLMQSLGAGNTIQALQNSVAPQYAQQDQQMMQMLATAGLAPSSTAGGTAFNNLAQQQLAGISPAMASAIQNSQANQLNAGQYNTSAMNQGNQYNAGVGNNAAQYNANALNSAAGINLGNQNAQQQYNANAYNNAGSNYFNALTGSYNNNANAFNALNNAGLSGTQGLAGQAASGANQLASGQQSNFPVYNSSGSPYSALGGAAGGYSAYAPTNSNAGYTNNSPYGQSDFSGVYGAGGSASGLNGAGQVTSDPYYGAAP